MIDFKADVRNSIVEILEKYNVKYKSSDDLHRLAVRFYTFGERYVAPRKRDVKVSEELSANLRIYPAPVQAAFHKMAEWVRDGVDINGFQSRGLYGQGSRDYQNMLYGIVHLHLSANEKDEKPVIKKNGFAKPGKYILLAHFNEAYAYFVKILEHPESHSDNGNIAVEWISKDILGIMEHNWPELLDNRKIENACLCDAKGNPISLDDKAMATLTSNHINTPFSLGNSLYMIGSGIMRSGDSAKAVMNADKLLNNTEIARMFYEKHKAELHKEFDALLKKNGWKVPDNCDVHYDYVDILNHFLIVDRNSGAAYDCRDGRMYLLFENEE